ncbi:MAG TPA: bifunctional phosphoribosyl-AMP cyclohydrolase/phosphoribosyl-ATP diphosphatase HisIE [Steroidobacteraceae bacterium]|nr:bifunctional phosphoribosyl-AMP cyclohydrolase/phosphoribosyl-ATP diphosphatase HisIE [Steroidobacteraceae bacterium]
MNQAEIDALDFDKAGGLVTAVVQHAATAAVLMVGHMNRAALEQTLKRGRVVFYSRSRQCLWEKGETSGNTLELNAIRFDCDRDALLVTATPAGPVCHTGTATCFGDPAATEAEPLIFLKELEGIIEQRRTAAPDSSYTARLFAQGTSRIAQKVGEEALEVALAAVTQTDGGVVAEAADLLFHLLVLLRNRGLSLQDVARELQSRHRQRAASESAR